MTARCPCTPVHARDRQHASPREECAYAVLASEDFSLVSLRPHRRRVGAARTPVADPSPAWPTARLGVAPPRQRALLCPAHWLCLALSAPRISAVAHDLFDLPSVALARGLAAGPRGVAPRRPPAGWSSCRPLGGDPG